MDVTTFATTDAAVSWWGPKEAKALSNQSAMLCAADETERIFSLVHLLHY